MKNTNEAAGKTARQGFYWKHEYTENCEALSASRLGHLIRLLDDFTQGTLDPTELELADPEVVTAFHFITTELKQQKLEEDERNKEYRLARRMD